MRFLSTCVAALIACAAAVRADEPPVALIAEPPAAVVAGPGAADAKAACVTVGWKEWGGCGVCVAAENGKSLVLSCNHVFDESGAGRLAPYPLACTVTAGGKQYPAVATAGDFGCDVALLVVDGELPVASIAAEQPTAGTKVWRNGRGTGYQTATVVPADPRWVNESCKFSARGVSDSGDSGSGYFNADNELVAIHCGRGDGMARGVPITSVKTVVRTAAPVRLFPRLRDRLGARRGAAVTVGPAMTYPEPPAAQVPNPPKVTVPTAAPVPVAAPPVTYYTLPQSGSSCPGGVCPAPGYSAPARRGIFR